MVSLATNVIAERSIFEEGEVKKEENEEEKYEKTHAMKSKIM